MKLNTPTQVDDETDMASIKYGKVLTNNYVDDNKTFNSRKPSFNSRKQSQNSKKSVSKPKKQPSKSKDKSKVRRVEEILRGPDTSLVKKGFFS